jgi:prolyl-tRNA editing enzyme YbaK/EbsC (Cys-tRNA(Pro) deacylase)
VTEPEHALNGPTADAVLDQIDRLGVEYEVVPCDPALADTTAFCAAYGFGLEESANAIVVVGKTEPRTYAACLVLANTRLDVNGLVRRRLGAKKASFASADETVELTGMRIGGVTPFGLAGQLPIWIDARIMDLDRVIVGGGSRDRKLLVPPAALAALDGSEIIPDLAKPLDPT